MFLESKIVWKEIIKLTEEMIYPSSIYCLCCGKAIDRTRLYSLCDSCVRNIKWATSKNCDKCGKPLQETWNGSLCADCIKIEHSFDKGYACCQYGAHSRAIIFSYKYNNHNYVGRFMAMAMADRLCGYEKRWDYVTFVPTGRDKIKTRGFDHMQIVAFELGKILKVPVAKTLLREKKTLPQRGLDAISRRENIRGAFGIVEYNREKIIGKSLLLIDDIYTTGATCDECAKVLKKGGAQRVDIACFAAGANIHSAPED